MKRILMITLAFVLIVFYTSASWGSVVGLGARAAAMGGAYTAIADDEYASYWNPAGITQIKHLDLIGGLSYQGDLDKLQNISDKVADNEMPDLDDLNQNYLLTGYLGFTTKYFALSAYTDSQLMVSIDQSLEINADVQSYNYGIVNIAGKIGEKLAVGVNLNSVVVGNGNIYSKELPDPTKYTDINKLVQDLQNYKGTVSYNTGSGTACDLGCLYQLTPQINLGLTLRNIINDVTTDDGKKYTYKVDPDFISSPSSEEPPLVVTETDTYGESIELPKSYILGLAYRPFENTLFATDIEMIANSDNDQTRVHLGLEQAVLKKLIALRLGYFTDKANNGTTYGLGFKLWIFETNMAVVNTDDSEYFLSGNMRF